LCGVPAWRELAKLRAEITGKDELIEVRKTDASGRLAIDTTAIIRWCGWQHSQHWLAARPSSGVVLATPDVSLATEIAIWDAYV
jgi:hypothetical protein